ncbi:MAG: rhodanese-related sulfurtransferase [Nanoarchaeota archaeon]|nr:rhodanese-related sulfurtransferase [Nanoarchaeota archaeon]
MKNILFYKYVDIEDSEQLKEEQFNLSKSLNLLGTILVANEGINGCLSGNEKDLEEYKKILMKNKRFSDIKFKEGPANKHTFKRLHVRVRDEIVSSNFDINVKNAAPYIEPKQLKQLLDNNGGIILLDSRNKYEVNIGKFKNAIHLDLDTFKQFSLKINQLKNNNKDDNNKKIHNNKNEINKKLLKNKKIILYCTGGVRCEKASAFLIENGFNNVFQLHGGILSYGNECGNTHWEGKCFVFDTRGAVDIDPNSQSEPITQCVLCNLPNADLHNCALTTCDKFFTACEDCFKVLKECCSKRCRGEINI